MSSQHSRSDSRGPGADTRPAAKSPIKTPVIDVGASVAYIEANSAGPHHAIIAADLGDGLVNLTVLDGPTAVWGPRLKVPYSSDGTNDRWALPAKA